MSKIKDIIIDDQLSSEICVDVILESGVVSTTKFFNINNRVLEQFDELKRKIIGIEVFDQASIDINMLRFSANNDDLKDVVLNMSLAVLMAASRELGVPLFKYISNSVSVPSLIFDVMDRSVSGFNRLMVVAQSDSIDKNVKIFDDFLSFFDNNVVEGSSIDDFLSFIVSVINKKGYSLKSDVSLALSFDVFSLNDDFLDSEFFSYCEMLCSRYGISLVFVSSSDDVIQLLMDNLGSDVSIVERKEFSNDIRKLPYEIGAEGGVIDVNFCDVGSVTKFIDLVDLAHKNNYKVIVSHANSAMVCDLAVALNVDYIRVESSDFCDRLVEILHDY